MKCAGHQCVGILSTTDGHSLSPFPVWMTTTSTTAASSSSSLQSTCCFQSCAQGELYVDDFETFQYREGKYIHRVFSFEKTQLTSKYVAS